MKKAALVGMVMIGYTATAAAALPPSARLSLDKDNIKVWTFHSGTNPAMQYQAQTILDVPLEQAVGLILNVEHAPQWVPYVSQTKLLSRNDKTGVFEIYMALQLPFPLKDRDVVIQGTMSKQSDGTILIQNRAVNSAYVVDAARLRLNHYQGDWTFKPISSRQVQVTTTGYADLGGAIPLGFMNKFVQQQPYQMLMKMKQELAKPKNAAIALPEILK